MYVCIMLHCSRCCVLLTLVLGGALDIFGMVFPKKLGQIDDKTCIPTN
jgi:hypothetical protein